MRDRFIINTCGELVSVVDDDSTHFTLLDVARNDQERELWQQFIHVSTAGFKLEPLTLFAELDYAGDVIPRLWLSYDVSHEIGDGDFWQRVTRFAYANGGKSTLVGAHINSDCRFFVNEPDKKFFSKDYGKIVRDAAVNFDIFNMDNSQITDKLFGIKISIVDFDVGRKPIPLAVPENYH